MQHYGGQAMINTDEMRALATTLEEIAPNVSTDYGPGQVATYGLCWEALREAAEEIDRLRAGRESGKSSERWPTHRRPAGVAW